MATDDDQALHEFVSTRYPDVRRSAFLMGGEWALADELTRAALANLVAESARGGVDDPEAYVYAEVMSAFHHRRARREHVFVATPAASDADPVRTILVLDALHRLSPRCRAVMVLRHWEEFEVDEIADILDLSDERVGAYAAAGEAALRDLLAEPSPPAESPDAPSSAGGPDAAGPDAAGPDAAGPDAAGPDAAGSDAAGSDAAGSDAAASAVAPEGAARDAVAPAAGASQTEAVRA